MSLMKNTIRMLIKLFLIGKLNSGRHQSHREINGGSLGLAIFLSSFCTLGGGSFSLQKKCSGTSRYLPIS